MFDDNQPKLWIWSGRAAQISGVYRLELTPATAQVTGPIVGFTATPQHCRFFKVGFDGTAVYADGSSVVLNEAFDMRVFCKSWELRWRRDGREARIALLSDVPFDFENLRHIGVGEGKVEPVQKSENAYLLWGEHCEGAPKSWSRFSSQRIGKLDVPVESTATRVALGATEYFRRDIFGNWVFMTERLSGLACS